MHMTDLWKIFPLPPTGLLKSKDQSVAYFTCSLAKMWLLSMHFGVLGVQSQCSGFYICGGDCAPAGSCSFLTCFFRSKFLQKPLPQVGQVKGFLSLWVCMWKVRLYTWWNALLQMEHLNCFSPLCVSLWFL